MNKEDLLKLGLTEEQAEKVLSANTEQLKGFIPKARFDEVNNAKKQAEKDLSDRDKQLETLKNSKEDTETLKATIESLQKENKTNAEQYQADLKAMTLDTAIKLAIAGKVHDENLVTGLFNKEALIVGEDGNIIGLDEQLKGLQKDKGFLFKEVEDPDGSNADGIDFKFGAGKNEPKLTEQALNEAFGLPSEK